jgi:hypothetical protein
VVGGGDGHLDLMIGVGQGCGKWEVAGGG